MKKNESKGKSWIKTGIIVGVVGVIAIGSGLIIHNNITAENKENISKDGANSDSEKLDKDESINDEETTEEWIVPPIEPTTESEENKRAKEIDKVNEDKNAKSPTEKSTLNQSIQEVTTIKYLENKDNLPKIVKIEEETVSEPTTNFHNNETTTKVTNNTNTNENSQSGSNEDTNNKNKGNISKDKNISDTNKTSSNKGNKDEDENGSNKDNGANDNGTSSKEDNTNSNDTSTNNSTSSNTPQDGDIKDGMTYDENFGWIEGTGGSIEEEANISEAGGSWDVMVGE